MKNNRNNFINRLLFKIVLRRKLKVWTTLKINDFYLDLLKNGYKSKYPRWKIQLSIDMCIKEIERRDKLIKSTSRVRDSH